MSGVHIEPGGNNVWLIHSAVIDVHTSPQVNTSHFGVYDLADNTFTELLDVTGTAGKQILFPAGDRVLLVTHRGDDRDVLATIDTASRTLVRQQTYPGDRCGFQLSPSGRAVVAIDRIDGTVHLTDTASLIDQTLPATQGLSASWGAHEDVLYVTDFDDPTNRTTSVLRFDLRSADLTVPVAQPTHLASVPAPGNSIVVSPDDRFLAVGDFSELSIRTHLTVINLATAARTTVNADGVPAFTNDDRLVYWQLNTEHGQDLRILEPTTGALTLGAADYFGFLPTSIALRRHDLVLTEESVEITTSFLLNTDDGTHMPVTTPPYPLAPHVSPTSMFEPPGRNELWFPALDSLWRLDLSSGLITGALGDVDSADYRAAADEVVVGRFHHAVYRVAMATGQIIGTPLFLADPNDAPARYKLGAD